MRVFFIMVGILASLSVMADKGDKWRVSDQDLTVWDSPNYLQKIGMIHRGYEIEELGIDGDMIKSSTRGRRLMSLLIAAKELYPQAKPVLRSR
ncbi:hypothetical protein DW830_06085 [Prevotella sp. AM34-19LB]|nr:hypothetical protein DW830_06085 [Prevotella sp. AM34-19LB]